MAARITFGKANRCLGSLSILARTGKAHIQQVLTCPTIRTVSKAGSEVVEYVCHSGWEVHGADNNMRADFFGAQGDTR